MNNNTCWKHDLELTLLSPWLLLARVTQGAKHFLAS